MFSFDQGGAISILGGNVIFLSGEKRIRQTAIEPEENYFIITKKKRCAFYLFKLHH